MVKASSIRRGEVWLVDAGGNRGSEVSFERPALVVQADAINRSGWETVAVIGITSNTRYADIPGNVLIRKSDRLLPKDSVIVCANLAAIDRSRFIRRMAVMPDLVMDQVAFGIALALDLH